MRKAKRSKQSLRSNVPVYVHASRVLIYLSLTIVALIVIPLSLFISGQDQNLFTHAAGASVYIAGYQTQNGSVDYGNNNLISATKVTTDANSGTLQTISLFLKKITAAPKNHMQVAVYADNGTGAPGTLITASTSQVAVPNKWNTFPLPGSVAISPNTVYWLAFNMDGANTQFGYSTSTGKSVFHFNTPFGTWPANFGSFDNPINQSYAIYMSYAGVQVLPTATPTPTNILSPTPTPQTSVTDTPMPTPTSQPTTSGWPGPSNTGIPPGTTLTAFTDSCTITAANTVIDAKILNCDLVIRAANVLVKNSKVNGLVYLDTDDPASTGWSVTVQDSEIDGGAQQRSVVGTGNVSVIRANVHGGITAVQCEEGKVFCNVQDSYLHGQYMPDGVDWHLGGFLSDGGNNIRLTHNYVICDHSVNNVGGGCTGDINLIPNFATISDVVIENNFFAANKDSSFCTYGGEKSTSPYPHADHVVYKDNVFQRGTTNKCAAYGPVTDFNSNGTGNQWINNTWEDGAPVPPEN